MCGLLLEDECPESRGTDKEKDLENVRFEMGDRRKEIPGSIFYPSAAKAADPD